MGSKNSTEKLYAEVEIYNPLVFESLVIDPPPPLEGVKKYNPGCIIGVLR